MEDPVHSSGQGFSYFAVDEVLYKHINWNYETFYCWIGHDHDA